ncbi:four helix bundle protein [Mariniphaga anaerophila]|uniref:Four helix bundle protein n=1 Tax=Mariniphaga anaerophila TaxID=1484053 RepID=A0A1M5FPF4_9BACT|nr:four helix bundle protein [Mariniphaga anaerophila]SHF93309.1 four helix bundle protein [Mariniphaga anaerophila]
MSDHENIVLDKSYRFAIRIVKMYQHLSSEKKEYVFSKQVLRSGTSTGENAEEAVGGISKADFRAKMSIAYKKARETEYWLRLLHNTGCSCIDYNRPQRIIENFVFDY